MNLHFDFESAHELLMNFNLNFKIRKKKMNGSKVSEEEIVGSANIRQHDCLSDILATASCCIKFDQAFQKKSIVGVCIVKIVLE